MKLLEGTDNEEEQDLTSQEQKQEAEPKEASEQTELDEEEIGKAVLKSKLGKAVGADGIPMEAWRYGGVTIKNGLTEVIRKVWKNGTIPGEWKQSIVVPLYKRGDPDKVGNYRGISLLCSAYKIYAEILRKRLDTEVEDKSLLPESQAGFRRKRSTLDNIYTLSHIVQREKEKDKEEKRVYALFIDLKAAFDNVDRDKLWDIMKNKGVDLSLLKRIKKIYEHTEVKVRSKDGITKSFMVNKGVRQGCVLSPSLFNLYIADLDTELEKRGIEGVQLGTKRVWSLAYADDMVLLAKNKVALEDMMDTLRRFLRGRKLELCVEKTKVMIFNYKGKGGRDNWSWNGKKIEEVRSFKYLGFTFNRNGNCIDHIQELYTKGRTAAKKVWGLGERLCKDDFARRWMLYKYLIQSTMMYGVEIWGWEEKKELEKIMLAYVRWVFRLEFCTPGYIILREFGLDKLRIRGGIRALKFEEKIKELDEKNYMKMCWKEKENTLKKELYSREKKQYFNRNGWSTQTIEDMRQMNIDIIGKLRERERDIQKRTLESKIRVSKYNKRYKEIGKDRPSYLLKENLNKNMKGDRVRALARIRCGNLEEYNKYWREEEFRKCIYCEVGQDSLEHYIGKCTEVRTRFDEMGRSEEEQMQRLVNDALDGKKGKLLEKIWKEKEKRLTQRKGKREVNKTTVDKSDEEVCTDIPVADR